MAAPLGANDPEWPNISATIWRTIGDCTNKLYFLEFCDMPKVVWVSLQNPDLKEDASVRMFNLASHLAAAGEVSGKFKPDKPIEFRKAETAVTCTPAS